MRTRGEGDLEPLLRLSLVRGVGPQRFAALVERFGSAGRALGASHAELERLPGIGPALAGEIVKVAGPAGDRRLASALRALERTGARAVTPSEAAYPEEFLGLADPPFLVYMAGDPSLARRPGVAVVGTRSPTPYGREVAAALSAGIAAAGLAVVSGLARGIDTIAHRGALSVDGATVAVLGHGIDAVYPPENRALFDEVRTRGLLITEMPPGEKPLAGNFPRRNRLIAALSRGVLVVEMGLKSGAQHTVTYALELGREVMAVPGPIGSESSAGTNQLIKEGARVVTCARDVIEELGGVGIATPARAAPVPAQEALPLLSGDEGRVLTELDGRLRHVDQLASTLSIEHGTLLGILLELELKGAIEALPGMQYRRRLRL